jgi:hypothetical protein
MVCRSRADVASDIRAYGDIVATFTAGIGLHLQEVGT